ncbi:NUDIX hydrolase [Geoalkalibacter halelectricus]|uniref:NUDIX hydrolase n=1 Tax=Geoalkalibacter halelectricus TaxID=2847045 RepID=A0ABY5ZLA1_9BACT|nr:NUDIX hydrolase [Geoalkalibacter halelectricus]MDO3378848.1 NUDIX hydrolase [Geoalkalibacter halelectricus]UWZ79848.1 NUDIX hydrolase [Geoalkalibacter halelectricus]
MNSPKHILVVGALVRNAAGQILLIRHHRRGWEIPQGRVEEGEGLLDALHREVREESGIDIIPGPLAAVFSKTDAPAALIFTFLANYHAGTLQPSDETPELGWFDVAEVMPQISHPVSRDRIETLLSFKDRTIFRTYTAKPFTIKNETRL